MTRPPYALNLADAEDISPTLRRVVEATGTPITTDTAHPFGLCAPVELVSIRDADTLMVSLVRGSLEWALRIAGINAPEKNTPEGIAARDFVAGLLADQIDLAVWVDLPARSNLLRSLTFDRIPADLILDDGRRLSGVLLAEGHAVTWQR